MMKKPKQPPELPSGARYLPDIVGQGYRRFWECRRRYRVVKGGKASKKSSTTALWYIVHMMKYPDANVMVIRNVYRTHENSTFAQLKWAIRRLGVEALWTATRSPLELIYKPTGQRILFRGMDRVDKLASTTVERGSICWVWIEEAFELRSEEDFNKLDLSMPRGEVAPPLFKQTTITFNPWSEQHWLKARFFDQPHPDVLAMTTIFATSFWMTLTVPFTRICGCGSRGDMRWRDWVNGAWRRGWCLNAGGSKALIRERCRRSIVMCLGWITAMRTTPPRLSRRR